MIRNILIRATLIAATLALSGLLAQPLAAQTDAPSVQVDPPDLQGSRPLEKQTEAAVIRDYLQSWQSMAAALDNNQPALLDADFVGTAHDTLAATVDEQTKLGIHTRYVARSHHLQIVFYSPEGLAIQLVDTVAYDEQIFDHDRELISQPVNARYVVVLTPSEVRWRVRFFQATPPASPAH